MNKVSPAAQKKAHTTPSQPLWERASGWYEDNTQWINIALVVVLIGVLGFQGYKYFHARKINKAGSEYSLVFQKLQEASAATDDAKRKDSLMGAVTAAQGLYSQYPDLYMGRQAQLLIGNAYYDLAAHQGGQGVGKGVDSLKKAKDAYEKYLAAAKTPNEKAAASLALGNVQQDLLFVTQDTKDYQKQSEDSYKQAIAAGQGTYLEGEAKLSLARLYLGQTGNQNQAEAAKLFQEVAKSRALNLTPDKKEVNVDLPTGEKLTQKQVTDIRGFADWSQQAIADKALKRFE